MLKRNIIIFIIIIFIFILDLLTKNYALDYLMLNHSLSINNFLNLTLAFNHGAAFSFLSEAGGWQRWFFIIFSFIVILIIAYITASDENSPYIAFSFVIGGALGNLNDRIIHGYVIDFIEFHYENLYWPIFNFADVAISIGVILLLYSMFLNKKEIK
tara:strand:+ start:2725 stop:3195 length:471 start_codon:yes stop_codon:yes gene_type:complete